MPIRTYRPGDETSQAQLYNSAASGLPAFKPASADEIRRRYEAPGFDPTTVYYLVERDATIGYAVFGGNGRISMPWCLPGHEDRRDELLSAVLEEMAGRGIPTAWAAYRSDWLPVHAYFDGHRFEVVRRMVNYVASVDLLPRTALQPGWEIRPIETGDWCRAREIAPYLFPSEADELVAFYGRSPFFSEDSAYVLEDSTGRMMGLGLALVDARFAHPTQVDAAMPCFRLGAFGTETERHKRINGLFSFVAVDDPSAAMILGEATRRFSNAGLTHASAQAPSDEPVLTDFFGRYFQIQGSFPIVSRTLAEHSAAPSMGARRREVPTD